MECTFCDFIHNGKTHHNDYPNHKVLYPFIPVYEDDKVIAFLSVPNFQKESDLLIVSRKHYEFLEEVPIEIYNKINKFIQKAMGLIRKNYGDCRLVLNNGRNVAQAVPHVHYHIIPQDKKRNHIWKGLSVSESNELSKELSDLFKNNC